MTYRNPYEIVIADTQVWIVDDDVDDHYILQEIFQKVAPTVELISLYDGNELVPHLEESQTLPKLILLDLNMDQVSGLEALRSLRSNTTYQELPVVVLTTSSRSTDKTRAIVLGANDFLVKPNNISQFEDMIRHLMQEWQIETVTI